MSEPTPVADVPAFSKAVFKALGMDLGMVTSFTLHCQPGELPSISLTRIIPASAIEPLGRLLEKYELRRVSEVSLPAVRECVLLKTMAETTLSLRASDAPDPT
jgi:hypothetical protein